LACAIGAFVQVGREDLRYPAFEVGGLFLEEDHCNRVGFYFSFTPRFGPNADDGFERTSPVEFNIGVETSTL